MLTKSGMNSSNNAYQIAQIAMAELKSAIYLILCESGAEGMRNVDIGRALGIYKGHIEHEGHISRTLLAIMEDEGVVTQDKGSKLWRPRNFAEEPESLS